MKFLIIAITTFSFYAQAKEYSQKDIDALVSAEVKKIKASLISKIKTKSVSELTSDVLKREEELEKSLSELKLKEERFNNSVKDFEKKLLTFEKKQSQFISCVDTMNNEKDLRIKKIVSVIAGMKPAKAADLISVQDTDIAVSILSKLDTTKASKVFNLLEKEKSAELQKLYLDMKK